MRPLLAKPDVSLETHSREVLECGKRLCQLLGVPPEVHKRALLACALHDIGKATCDFQEKMQGKRSQTFPHALASLPLSLMAEKCTLNSPLLASAAVLTHHSPLTSRLYRSYLDSKPTFCTEALEDLLRNLWHSLKEAGLTPCPSPEDLVQKTAHLPPASLLHKAQTSLLETLRTLPELPFAQVKAILHLADWTASSGKPPTALDHLFLQKGHAAVEHNIAHRGLTLYGFQQTLKDLRAHTNTLVLRAPTGTGKTEGLLLWGSDQPRLIYLLPTQATANAMRSRLQQIFGKDQVGLAHGRSLYLLRKEATDSEEYEEPPLDIHLWDRAFARPVMVATLDQYLIAHLHGKYWEERLTLSQNACVILDELHAYEPFTLGLLQEALNRFPPRKMALASATLPDTLLQPFFDQHRPKLIEAEDELWDRKRHHLYLHEAHLNDSLPVEEIKKAIAEGQRVLVVLNTVIDAQTLYTHLTEQGIPALLLHSRFTYRDRQHKEAQALQPAAGQVLIATQVVEVSLDISYDVLYTEIAPIDALVQRLGRVNRLGNQPPAPVHLFLQWNERSQRVYTRPMLEESLRIVSAIPTATPSSRDWSTYTAAYYQQLIDTPDYQSEWDEGRQNLQELRKLLGIYTIDLEDEELRSRFATRNHPMSVEVLPQQFVEEALALKEKKALWRLPELLVPIPINWLAIRSDLFTPSAELGVMLTQFPYDTALGLILSVDAEPANATHDLIW